MTAPRTAPHSSARSGRAAGPRPVRTDAELATRAAKHILFNGVALHSHTGKPSVDGKGTTRQPVCIARALERAAAGQKTDGVKDRLHRYLAGLGLGGMATYVDLYIDPGASPVEVKQQVAGMLQEFAAHCSKEDAKQASAPREDSRQKSVEADTTELVAA